MTASTRLASSTARSTGSASSPMSSRCCCQPSAPATSSSWTISAATSARQSVASSAVSAPDCSSCRPTRPISTRSSRSSPSSRPCCAKPTNDPSKPPGDASVRSSTASPPPSAPTTSKTQAMLQPNGSRSKGQKPPRKRRRNALRFSALRGAWRAAALLPQILEEFLDPGEEPFALGVGFAVLAFFFEFAQQFLLTFAQVGRRLDDRVDVHVAAQIGAQHGHALAAQAELVARLGARRHRHAGAVALDGRHLDRAAERRSGNRDRYPAEDVGTVALKDLVLRDADEDVEVARGGAMLPGLALAGEADAGAVLDPGRDVDRQRLLAPNPSLSAAGAARLVDRLPRTLTGRAGALERE